MSAPREATVASDRWVTDWAPSDRFPFYTRGNASEVLPDPVTPLGWSFVFERALLPGWRDAYLHLGAFCPEELDERRPEFAGVFGGYFYLNLSAYRVMGLRMGGTFEAIDEAYVGAYPRPPLQPHPGDDCDRCRTRWARTKEWAREAVTLPDLDADERDADRIRLERPPLHALSNSELVSRMRALLPALRRAFFHHHLVSNAASIGPIVLNRICTGVGRPELHLPLISGLGGVVSAEPSLAIWELSRLVRASPAAGRLMDEDPGGLLASDGSPDGVRATMRALLALHGYRGPKEYDIGAPSWEVDPTPMLRILDAMRRVDDGGSPALRLAALTAERAAAVAEISAVLGPTTEAGRRFETAVRSSALFLAGRERTKRMSTLLINEVRLAALELGARGVAAGAHAAPQAVMMLTGDEIDGYAADPTSSAGLIDDRQRTHAELARLRPPYTLSRDDLPFTRWPRRAQEHTPRTANGDVLHGMAGSSGTWTGTARVVTDPEHFDRVQPGDVLVSPSSDAAMTPLYLIAGAAVLDIGDITSHGVMISRELGIPCVVSVTDATKRIPDGSTVTVDAATGSVTVISTPSAEPGEFNV